MPAKTSSTPAAYTLSLDECALDRARSSLDDGAVTPSLGP